MTYNLMRAVAARGLDANADSVSGALFYVFANQTTTAQTTYTDETLATANAHPVVANSAGAWGGIYIGSGTYTVDIRAPGGSSLPGYPVDNVIVPEIDDSYATKADAEAATPNQDALRIKGYAAAGDGGGGLYKRVGAEPSHIFKLQSADGAWWELVPEGGEVWLEQAGADNTGATSVSSTLLSAFAFAAGRFWVRAGHGTFLLGTKAFYDWTTHQQDGNFYYPGVLFRGSGSATIFECDVDNDYALDLFVPYDTTPRISWGMQLKDFRIEPKSGALNPKGIRLGSCFGIHVSGIENTTGFDKAIHFDATTTDQDSTSGTMERCRFTGAGTTGTAVEALPTNGTGVTTLTGFIMRHVDMSGGAYNFAGGGLANVTFQHCFWTNAATDNIYLKALPSLTNRNVQFLGGGEIGNNTSGTPAMCRIESMQGLYAARHRFVRNSGETGRYGFYFDNVAGALISNVVLDQNIVVIDGTDDFTMYGMDASAPTFNIRRFNTVWNTWNTSIATDRLDSPAKWGPPAQNVFQSSAGTTGTGTVALNVDEFSHFNVVADESGGTIITASGTASAGDEITMRVSNGTGGANATTFDSDFLYDSFTLASGEERYLTFRFGPTDEKWIQQGAYGP